MRTHCMILRMEKTWIMDIFDRKEYVSLYLHLGTSSDCAMLQIICMLYTKWELACPKLKCKYFQKSIGSLFLFSKTGGSWTFV